MQKVGRDFKEFYEQYYHRHDQNYMTTRTANMALRRGRACLPRL